VTMWFVTGPIRSVVFTSRTTTTNSAWRLRAANLNREATTIVLVSGLALVPGARKHPSRGPTADLGGALTRLP